MEHALRAGFGGVVLVRVMVGVCCRSRRALADIVGEVCRYEVLGDRRCPCSLSIGE